MGAESRPALRRLRYQVQRLPDAGRNGPAGYFKRENNSHFWNYQTGLVYKPAPNGSIYLAWSTSSNPTGETGGEGQADISVGNNGLDPGVTATSNWVPSGPSSTMLCR